MARILIIDDEADMLDNCRRILKRSGYDCLLLQESENLAQVLKEDSPDLILTDLRMPKKDGMSVLKEAKAMDPDIVVLLFTAYGTIKSALEACKLGAFDYIQKPFSAEQLRIAVNRGIKQKRLSDENKYLRSQLKEAYGFNRIIGKKSLFHIMFDFRRKGFIGSGYFQCNLGNFSYYFSILNKSKGNNISTELWIIYFF